MESTKSVEYARSSLPAYIAEQLNMGNLEGFFPVSFIQNKGGSTGIYRIDPYVTMQSAADSAIDVLLQVFLDLLALLEKMEYNYVFPEDYRIDEETVYIDPKQKKVRLLYLENEGRIGAKEQLCRLLEQWESMASTEGIGYLKSLRSYLLNHQIGYRSAIHHVEELHHEVCVCGVL